MISADVKVNVKQKEIKKNWWLHLDFYKKYLQNLKYSIKRSCNFYLILLVFHPACQCSLRTGSEDFYLINKQNLLSVTKVYLSMPPNQSIDLQC